MAKKKYLFPLACLLAFAICVAGRLNGSATSLWYFQLEETAHFKGIIAGTPKPTRSDEWMVWTPALLSQLRHDPPMPAVNETLGAGVSPLLMSLPVRHYSMIFRPQLWGFFLFDAERGFSWFWGVKLFGLLAVLYLLFLVLARGRIAIAVLGSLALTFSSFIQWWFSSPAMLPEMLTAWALALVCGWTLFGPGWWPRKLLASAVLVACAINFMLCCYPPFELPLTYLALFLFAAFLWQRRGRSMRGGFWWIGGSTVLALLLLWPTFAQCRPTLEIVAHTSYPGARRGTGGDMSATKYLSGLFNFFDGEQEHADLFPNSSEASNFLPLGLPALALIGWTWWRRKHGPKRHESVARSPALLVALAAFVVFFSIYLLVGLPSWFCRITALNFCTEKRMLLAVGIAGLMLAILTLRADGAPLLRGWRAAGAAALTTLAALVFLLLNRHANPHFLTANRLVYLFAASSVLVGAYLCARPRLFGTLLAGALLLNNGLVNPIAVGLPGLLDNPAAERIAAIHRTDPHARWAAFEHSSLPQFIRVTGAPVFNGVKIVPDLDLLGQLDPSGQSHAIYNRYAYIVLRLPAPHQTEPRFLALTDDAYALLVAPTDPALRAHGVKYFVFRRALQPAEMSGLHLREAMPERLCWIYEADEI